MLFRSYKNDKRINAKAEQAITELESDMSFESRMLMIQQLIPLGLQAVAMELQQSDVHDFRQSRDRVQFVFGGKSLVTFTPLEDMEDTEVPKRNATHGEMSAPPYVPVNV